MNPTRYRIFPTAAGFCAIGWSDAGIVRFGLPAESAEAAEAHIRRCLPNAEPGDSPDWIGKVVAEAQAYFAGEAVAFDALPLDLGGQPPARRAIYAALQQVGRGETTTYGALALAAGLVPQAAREVGQAMAHNPIPLIIPCHRVLAADGKVGGFSAPGGAESKIRMLSLEGVAVGTGPSDQYSLPF